ncbi:MAG TPA: hypothetical protein VNU72_06440 [Puia sp.]|nr:hypothetical protein [Puia sp.]
MIKYPVTIVLILLISVQTFSKWCLIFEFQANRDYISKNLCINRSRPSCCCRGKCYLDKKMAEDESSRQTPGRSGLKEESVWQCIRQADCLVLPLVGPARFAHSTRHLPGEPQEYIHSFFPPPKTAA